MCGIAGYRGTADIDDGRVQECLRRMGRRGPDHGATLRLRDRDGGHVVFVHTRLNIIDPDERANQPFKVGEKTLIYNGELYNYVEVKKDLAGDGHTFRTESDTEVFLKAVDARGWGVLDRCEGMWAAAVWDAADDSLTLSRDRFGEKPLYLYRDETGLYFGSEVKLIAALLGRKLKVNYDQVYRFWVNGYKALYKGDSTFFEGLTELPAASVLRIGRDRSEKLTRYWMPGFTPQDEMTWEEAVAGARQHLIRSVELRLRADVPLAFCMSGGVDSNALISIAKRVFDYDVHGFTIVNDDPRYDETEIVTQAVKELGIRHTEIPVQTGDFLGRLRTLVRYHDAPVYTITYFAQWLLEEAISGHGYRISISGTAADELYSGYYDHHLFYLRQVYEDRALHAASVANWEREVKPIVRNPYLSNPGLFVKDPAFRGHIYLGAEEFSSYLVKPWMEPFREERFTDDLLRNRMLNELRHEAVPVILHEDDLNSMYYSVENRSPYLDRDLFEFCGKIPTRHLIQNGRAKAVLRASMRGIVPDVVLDSPRKVGFNAPIFSFLDPRDPAVRAQLLDDSPVFDHIRRDAVESLLDKASLPNSESKFLFYFVSTKMFLEEFA